MAKLLAGALAAVLLLVAGSLVFIYSGAYNVAASERHAALADWLLHTTMRQSVQARAGQAPAAKGPGEEGALHFAQMCQPCHGGPGVERGDVGKGLTPTPPNLGRVIARWSDAEAFWIVKHGIKFTGMPAFGKTHSDEQIAAIVAFLRALPDMKPEEYREMTAEAPGHPHGAPGEQAAAGQGG